MSWSRFDDRYAQHPKLVALGDWHEVGLALDVAGIGWCNLNETDGDIPKPQVDRLIRCANMRIGKEAVTPQEVARRLVAVGRWDDLGDKFRIHDFLTYNPSRAQNEEKRRQTAERVKRHRNGVTRGDVTHDVTRVSAPRNTAPEPEPEPEPEPVPEERSGERSSGAPAPVVPLVTYPLEGSVPPPDPIPPGWVQYGDAHGCKDTPKQYARFAAKNAHRRLPPSRWQSEWIAWTLNHPTYACPCGAGGATRRGGPPGAIVIDEAKNSADWNALLKKHGRASA